MSALCVILTTDDLPNFHLHPASFQVVNEIRKIRPEVIGGVRDGSATLAFTNNQTTSVDVELNSG